MPQPPQAAASTSTGTRSVTTAAPPAAATTTAERLPTGRRSMRWLARLPAGRCRRVPWWRPEPRRQQCPRVTALADDGKELYAATAGGGVWGSNNGGGKWTPMSDDQASLSTGALAVNP